MRLGKLSPALQPSLYPMVTNCPSVPLSGCPARLHVVTLAPLPTPAPTTNSQDASLFLDLCFWFHQCRGLVEQLNGSLIFSQFLEISRHFLLFTSGEVRGVVLFIFKETDSFSLLGTYNVLYTEHTLCVMCFMLTKRFGATPFQRLRHCGVMRLICPKSHSAHCIKTGL